METLLNSFMGTMHIPYVLLNQEREGFVQYAIGASGLVFSAHVAAKLVYQTESRTSYTIALGAVSLISAGLCLKNKDFIPLAKLMEQKYSSFKCRTTIGLLAGAYFSLFSPHIFRNRTFLYKTMVMSYGVVAAMLGVGMWRSDYEAPYKYCRIPYPRQPSYVTKLIDDLKMQGHIRILMGKHLFEKGMPQEIISYIFSFLPQPLEITERNILPQRLNKSRKLAFQKIIDTFREKQYFYEPTLLEEKEMDGMPCKHRSYRVKQTVTFKQQVVEIGEIVNKSYPLPTEEAKIEIKNENITRDLSNAKSAKQAYCDSTPWLIRLFNYIFDKRT